jgi:SWIM zinc finger
MSFLYDCWRLDETTCLVKLAEDEVTAEGDHDQDRDGTVQETRDRLRKSWLIPKFSRTRTVTIRKDTALGVWVALCTCGTGERYGMCCRHIYRALDISPDKFHARFSYWKVYDLLSLGNDLPAEL